MLAKDSAQWSADLNDPMPSVREIAHFADCWASQVEALMDGGRKLEDVAEQIFREICPANDRISFLFYYYSLLALRENWEYGEELVGWHNRRVGQENAKLWVLPLAEWKKVFLTASACQVQEEENVLCPAL